MCSPVWPPPGTPEKVVRLYHGHSFIGEEYSQEERQAVLDLEYQAPKVQKRPESDTIDIFEVEQDAITSLDYYDLHATISDDSEIPKSWQYVRAINLLTQHRLNQALESGHVLELPLLQLNDDAVSMIETGLEKLKNCGYFLETFIDYPCSRCGCIFCDRLRYTKDSREYVASVVSLNSIVDPAYQGWIRPSMLFRRLCRSGGLPSRIEQGNKRNKLKDVFPTHHDEFVTFKRLDICPIPTGNLTRDRDNILVLANEFTSKAPTLFKIVAGQFIIDLGRSLNLHIHSLILSPYIERTKLLRLLGAICCKRDLQIPEITWLASTDNLKGSAAYTAFPGMLKKKTGESLDAYIIFRLLMHGKGIRRVRRTGMFLPRYWKVKPPWR